MSERIRIGRLRGQIEYTSGPQFIDSYPGLEFVTWRFVHLSSHIADGATIFLEPNATTPPQKVLAGSFYEQLVCGRASLTVCDPRPQLYSRHTEPVIVDPNSAMQWTAHSRCIVQEMSLPGFENCILQNLPKLT